VDVRQPADPVKPHPSARRQAVWQTRLLSASVGTGYILARMRHDIVLTPEAGEDFDCLTARLKAIVRSGMEVHLRYEPTRASRSRIKRLRGIAKPQYRLRLEELRVFYDVEGRTVSVLAIVPKKQAAEWLERYGVR
jgi:mRNA-degrading endonuclease RelE of RelBE toxin-antitoxin system